WLREGLGQAPVEEALVEFLPFGARQIGPVKEVVDVLLQEPSFLQHRLHAAQRSCLSDAGRTHQFDHQPGGTKGRPRHFGSRSRTAYLETALQQRVPDET